MASTARVRAAGTSMSRTGSWPGRTRSTIIRRRARTCRTSSRAAARVERRSRGISTARTASSIRICAVSSPRSGARRARSTRRPLRHGRALPMTLLRRSATKRRAARAASCARTGTRYRSSSLRLCCTRRRSTARTATSPLPSFRQSPCCRTLPARASCSSWVVQRSRSTTGMLTCRLRARRSGATRRMCRSPRTGSTQATS